MAAIDFKRKARLSVCCLAMIGVLSGCGLTQSVSQGTVSMTKSLFYKKIDTLHLDFTPRSALNTDEDRTPLSVVLRVYQLKARQALDDADYQDLLMYDDATLKADWLAQRDVTIKPFGSESLNMPLNPDAKFIAIVGLFRAPEQKGGWKLILEREMLDPDMPRVIEVGNGALTLLPMKD
ncbi:type VI secretion system lipoprotein TssJ [Pectobacterium sp. B1J-3]|uniref:type VI secretion system lipoprotein TssJ n=1 Tax=Pectobacterium sp. B1J-3 TaxID=3385371 RepID=UPI0039063982